MLEALDKAKSKAENEEVLEEYNYQKYDALDGRPTLQ